MKLFSSEGCEDEVSSELDCVSKLCSSERTYDRLETEECTPNMSKISDRYTSHVVIARVDAFTDPLPRTADFLFVRG